MSLQFELLVSSIINYEAASKVKMEKFRQNIRHEDTKSQR